MPPKSCPNCSGTDLQADYTSGRVECQGCGYIVEENILVSEVGFAEAAGGRVHVQGAFVANGSNGIGGLRGRNSQQSAENIKNQGQMRITHVASHMGLNHSVRQGAVRLFALAVDANFHKGRRKDYVIASCLYLQSRLKREPHMLIDFSERLQINVFELGGTYLKLRTTLHLPDPMPMTDPAIYSLRFANRLDLGQDKHKVATDASRLVRRFQADWMSEGRRPAGVCGACLLVASRMNGYHRTPEEIAQIVKVSPSTVKRRLLEFARTDMANKTVEEWKKMSDADLDAPGESLPPVVKDQIKRDAKRRKLDANGRSESAEVAEGEEGEDEDEEEGSDTEERRDKSQVKRKRSGAAGEGASARPNEEEGEEEDEEDRRKRVEEEEAARARSEAKRNQMGTAIQQATELLNGEEEEDGEDADLAPPVPGEYVRDLDAAGDNPEDAQNERARAVRKFRRINKVASMGEADADVDLEDLQEDAEEFDQEEEDEVAEQEDGEEGEKDDDGGEKEERAASSSLKPNVQDDEARFRHLKFDNWDDSLAVRKHVEEKYMPRIRLESALTDKHVDDRLQLWLGVRDPREIMVELEVVNRALRKREKDAKADPEDELDDVDDDEIEGIIAMTEDEQRTRARMWLSHNGRWLEEDKEKQLKKAEYERDNADKITRKKMKKRNKPAKRNQPFRTPQEAMGSFMTEKNFSSRINVAALKELGLDLAEGYTDELQVMEDEKSDDEKEDDSKHDSSYPGAEGFDYGHHDLDAYEAPYGDDE